MIDAFKNALSPEKARVDGYSETVARLEPDIAMIDPGAFYASAAISLKRIADAFEQRHISVGEEIETALDCIAEGLPAVGDEPASRDISLSVLNSLYKRFRIISR